MPCIRLRSTSALNKTLLKINGEEYRLNISANANKLKAHLLNFYINTIQQFFVIEFSWSSVFHIEVLHQENFNKT